MRAIVISIAMSLAACSGQDQAAEDATAEPAATEAASTTATAFDGGPNVGVFEARSTEGVVLTQTAAGDGTIVSVDGEGNSVSGAYTMGDGRFCITNEGEDGPSCFAYSDLKDDGSWTATNVDDPSDVWTVRRLTK